jgi:predicted porin
MTSKTSVAALCTVAVVLAVNTAPAHAQSNVTLFGVLDAAIEYVNDDATPTIGSNSVVTPGEGGMRLTNGGQQQTRFGIRGTEDLGGGLRAIFTLEHRFAIDTGNTLGGAFPGGNQRFWNGQAWVGLQGNRGRLTAGRQYTPLYNVLQPVDATAYQFYNNLSTLFLNRFDNSLEYRSPTFAGVTVNAMYGFGENLEASTTPGVRNEAGDSYALGAQWRSGGFCVGGAYTASDRTISTGNDLSEWGLGAQYRFGSQTTLGAGYISTDRLGRDTSFTFDSGSLGLGAGTLFLNCVRVDEDTRGSSNRLGLAYAYPLSKRTNTYVATGMTTDLAVGSGANLRYLDPTLASIGIRHLF